MQMVWGKVLLFTLLVFAKTSLIHSNPEELPKNNTSTLKERLSDYKIVNPTRRTSLNLAIIGNMQFLDFDINYKNSNGETKKRKYHLEFYSYGAQLELALKVNFIVISEPELNFYNTNKEIELGVGLDIKTPIFDITYIPFKNMPGNIKIFSIPITNLLIFSGILLNETDHFCKNTKTIILDNLSKILDFYYKKPIYIVMPLVGIGTTIVTNGYLTPVELL